MKKIMIADDEPGLVEMIKGYFEMSGYEVITAQDGTSALEKISQRPDLILLDINMPGMDGLEVCRLVREHVTCPVIFLTARLENGDKIAGFGAGADDYIVKPFDIDVLGAQVEAHLRREERRTAPSAVRFFGELTVDYSARRVTVGGEPVPLSRREFDIVELLSLNERQIFDRERIYETIWGVDGAGYSNTVLEHIRKVRVKLSEKTLHNYIETVWGCGYRWNG